MKANSLRGRAFVLGIALMMLVAAAPSVWGQSEKPNILVIWGDDIGRDNISAYSRGMMGYYTPNIDRIANEGALFTDYYAEQSCTAGRSSFITGQLPFRVGLSKVGMPGAKQNHSVIITVAGDSQGIIEVDSNTIAHNGIFSGLVVTSAPDNVGDTADGQYTITSNTITSATRPTQSYWPACSGNMRVLPWQTMTLLPPGPAWTCHASCMTAPKQFFAAMVMPAMVCLFRFATLMTCLASVTTVGTRSTSLPLPRR